MIPLTKVLNPEDYKEFHPGMKQLLDEVRALEGQHHHRMWEYLMALEAVRRWADSDGPGAFSAYDVGGAGSNFKDALDTLAYDVMVIDPSLNGTVEDFEGERREVVICISVIEHVAEQQSFLEALAKLVVPGGLLFLTADYCGDPEHQHHFKGTDGHHFHWMRQRIYDQASWTNQIAMPLIKMGMLLPTWGKLDMTWHGPQVYDYSFASLAMIKEVE